MKPFIISGSLTDSKEVPMKTLEFVRLFKMQIFIRFLSIFCFIFGTEIQFFMFFNRPWNSFCYRSLLLSVFGPLIFLRYSASLLFSLGGRCVFDKFGFLDFIYWK